MATLALNLSLCARLLILILGPLPTSPPSRKPTLAIRPVFGVHYGVLWDLVFALGDLVHLCYERLSLALEDRRVFLSSQVYA